MVFITAGMGGGTGTGVGPIVAKVARELGILTVVVVTQAIRLRRQATENQYRNCRELQANVDSLIVILNDKLMDVL